LAVKPTTGSEKVTVNDSGSVSRIGSDPVVAPRAATGGVRSEIATTAAGTATLKLPFRSWVFRAGRASVSVPSPVAASVTWYVAAGPTGDTETTDAPGAVPPTVRLPGVRAITDSSNVIVTVTWAVWNGTGAANDAVGGVTSYPVAARYSVTALVQISLSVAPDFATAATGGELIKMPSFGFRPNCVTTTPLPTASPVTDGPAGSPQKFRRALTGNEVPDVTAVPNALSAAETPIPFPENVLNERDAVLDSFACDVGSVPISTPYWLFVIEFPTRTALLGVVPPTLPSAMNTAAEASVVEAPVNPVKVLPVISTLFDPAVICTPY
jgi:hypothetical protein